MVNKKQLEEFYKQNLENDIINTISEMKGIDLRKALDIYYSSKLAEQITAMEQKIWMQNILQKI